MDAKQNSITVELTRQVARDIVAGDLEPGSRLKIPGLGAKYGTSAIPLREALARLASQGLVLFEDRKGFSVAPVSRADLIDLTEVRIAIECLTLTRSIERGDVEWETDVLSAAHRLARLPTYDDEAQRHLSTEWEAAHTRFHHCLVSACGSSRLLGLRDLYDDQSRRYRYLMGLLAREPRIVDGEHKDLVDAVLSRDVARACELITEHFQKTTDMILNSKIGTLS